MKNHFNQTGFTLIETLVAVTILLIGILGPLLLLTRGITDGLYAQNELAANYLAQEALETAVNQRNNNLVSGNNWDLNFPLSSCSDPSSNSSVCSINLNSNSGINVVPGCEQTNSPCALVFDAKDSHYVHPNVASPHAGDTLGPIFTRYVYLSRTGQQIKVTAKVMWVNVANKSQTRTLLVSTYLSPQI